ncbi:MAG: hypothetical protein ABJL44_15305 [Algibacter sp.]
MKESENKYVDNLSKKIIKEAAVESPSFNFTDTVMSQIETLSVRSSVTAYKPLISIKGWLVIAIVFIALLIIMIMTSEGYSLDLLNKINFSIISNNKMGEALSNIKISKTLTYTIALFGLMLSIQIPWLKHYFDKRLEV